jgi:putative mRNA 3-end processing factor
VKDADLIELRPQGLYCPAGDFYIDPWRSVERAVITHAHADHARTGHAHYLAASSAEHVLRTRLGDIHLQRLDYGEPLRIGQAKVSLHPAGHVLGSAQVRVEVAGRIWVVSGDYRLQADRSCAPFEPVACHTFVTESTFGLPVYRWQEPAQIFAQINAWWQANARENRASVLFCYALGKAQRILAGIDPRIGPILCHGAVERINEAYRATGVVLPPTLSVADRPPPEVLARCLVLAPPSAAGSTWMRRFAGARDAFVSGWMLVRGARRRRGVDHGFVLSDHADWPDLNAAIDATGAQQVIVTHGQVPSMVRWLSERGLHARAFETPFDAMGDGEAPPASDAHGLDVTPAPDGPDDPARAAWDGRDQGR